MAGTPVQIGGQTITIEQFTQQIGGAVGRILREVDLSSPMAARSAVAFLPVPLERGDFESLFAFGTSAPRGDYGIVVLSRGGEFKGAFLSGIDVMEQKGGSSQGFLFEATSIAQMTDKELRDVRPDSGLVRFIAIPIVSDESGVANLPSSVTPLLPAI